ncbi:MAG: bifunctional riboflavin kinase/FAD synthetase [Oscillospiraceae bacterium]|nr:bifunctional riboflavin kinase/FAD synthetase [Oscillospiraceae bacterium]
MSEIKRAIALGFFDGVHIGHGALLNKTRERAAQINGIPSVLSFDVHPDTLVFGKEVPLINSALSREEIIRRCYGIENVVFIHFNQHTMRMPWQEFADTIIEELNLGWIVVGHDFCFGYKGQGTAARLKEYCEKRGIGCDIIPAVSLDGVTVSSTYIRTLVADGNMEQAARFLGHPHTLQDTVHSGYHLGTKMGTPTINMHFPEGVIIPRHGVYAAKVFLEDGSGHIAVTNIGVRPTVSDDNRVNVESHLLNYSGNLYGRQARVEFYKFLRPERKFENYTELAAQIRRDAEEARAYFQARGEDL